MLEVKIRKGAGGARPGAGRKRIHPEKPPKETPESKAVAEKSAIDATSRGVLANLLADGGLHPIEAMFKSFRHFDRMAEEALDRRDELPDDDDHRIERASLDKQAGEFFEKSHKQAKDLIPFIQPKLANVDQDGRVPESSEKGNTINVFLQGAIDRLAAGMGTQTNIIDAVRGGAGAADLRLGLLEQTGTAPAEAQPEQS